MNPGPAEEAGKVASGIVESFKQQPLSLALVIMNLALLAFFWQILTTVALQRKTEMEAVHKSEAEIRTLLSKCVVPP